MYKMYKLTKINDSIYKIKRILKFELYNSM